MRHAGGTGADRIAQSSDSDLPTNPLMLNTHRQSILRAATRLRRACTMPARVLLVLRAVRTATCLVPALVLAPSVRAQASPSARGAGPRSVTLAISAKPVPFSVRVVGRGPAMFFIPGLTSGGTVWDDIVAAFKDRYECHVFTLAGFAGQPPVAADSTWLPRMRDAIIAYARERGVAPPILVGHSLGGFLALDIAATVPSMPKAVVNVDGLPFLAATMSPNATAESVRPMAEQMRRAMQGGATAQSDQMQEQQLRMMIRDTTKLPMARAMGRASDPATVAEAMYALYVTDLRPRLAQVTAPVLNVHAWVAYRNFGQSRQGMDQLVAAQYAALPNATTRISDTAYHFIMFDEPRWLVTEMQAFLAAQK